MSTMIIDLSREMERLASDIYSMRNVCVMCDDTNMKIDLQDRQWYTPEFTEECIRALVTSRIANQNPMYRLIEYTVVYDRVHRDIERLSVPLIYPFICNSLSVVHKRKQICVIYFYGGVPHLRAAYPRVSDIEMQHLVSILDEVYNEAQRDIAPEYYDRIYDTLMETFTLRRIDQQITDFVDTYKVKRLHYVIKGGYLVISS